uniref:Uncharacterized protein n=1 Tax=Arundo donax TaxID=35708 RepID=A0A0A9BFZ6_ARUDO
MEGVGSLRV